MIIKRELYKYPLLLFDIIEVIFRTFILGWKNFVFLSNKKNRPQEANASVNGLHILKADSAGEIKCDACLICQTQCPAQCIHIEGQGNKLVNFKIEMLKCTFCGMCEEVCPIDAICLGPHEVRVGAAQQQWTFDQEILAYRKNINLNS